MHTVLQVVAGWLAISIVVAMLFGKFARVGRNKE